MLVQTKTSSHHLRLIDLHAETYMFLTHVYLFLKHAFVPATVAEVLQLAGHRAGRRSDHDERLGVSDNIPLGLSLPAG